MEDDIPFRIYEILEKIKLMKGEKRKTNDRGLWSDLFKLAYASNNSFIVNSNDFPGSECYSFLPYSLEDVDDNFEIVGELHVGCKTTKGDKSETNLSDIMESIKNEKIGEGINYHFVLCCQTAGTGINFKQESITTKGGEKKELFIVEINNCVSFDDILLKECENFLEKRKAEHYRKIKKIK